MPPSNTCSCHREENGRAEKCLPNYQPAYMQRTYQIDQQFDLGIETLFEPKHVKQYHAYCMWLSAQPRITGLREATFDARIELRKTEAKWNVSEDAFESQVAQLLENLYQDLGDQTEAERVELFKKQFRALSRHRRASQVFQKRVHALQNHLSGHECQLQSFEEQLYGDIQEELQDMNDDHEDGVPITADIDGHTWSRDQALSYMHNIPLGCTYIPEQAYKMDQGNQAHMVEARAGQLPRARDVHFDRENAREKDTLVQECYLSGGMLYKRNEGCRSAQVNVESPPEPVASDSDGTERYNSAVGRSTGPNCPPASAVIVAEGSDDDAGSDAVSVFLEDGWVITPPLHGG